MFFIMEVSVTDRDTYVETVDQYVPKARSVERYGGTMRVAGGHVDVLVGDWKPKNLLIVEFADKDGLDSWTKSDDCADLMELVGRSGALSAVTVAGM